MEQSIPLCVGFAVESGFVAVLSSMVLIYPELQQKQGKPWSACGLRLALAANLVLQVISSLSNVASYFFGPVTIALPVYVASQLVFNMILLGGILHSEAFAKNLRVGTYTVALAVVLLPIVGPGVQANEGMGDRFLRPAPLALMLVLLLVMLVSAAVMLWTNRSVEAPAAAEDPVARDEEAQTAPDDGRSDRGEEQRHDSDGHAAEGDEAAGSGATPGQAQPGSGAPSVSAGGSPAAAKHGELRALSGTSGGAISDVGRPPAEQGKVGLAFVSNLSAQVAASVLCATTSKAFVLVGGGALIAMVSIFALGATVITIGPILQVKFPQAKFVPFYTACNIIVNAIAGIVIWEDWRAIGSWLGYVTIIVQLLLGVYMLSEQDFFGGVSERGMRLKARAMTRHSVTKVLTGR